MGLVTANGGGGARAATVTRPTGRQSKKEYFIDPRLTNAALSLSVDRNSSARRCGGQNVHVLSCL